MNDAPMPVGRVQPPVDHKGRPITNRPHTVEVLADEEKPRWALVRCGTCDYRHRIHISEIGEYKPPLSCVKPPSGFKDPAKPRDLRLDPNRDYVAEYKKKWADKKMDEAGENDD